MRNAVSMPPPASATQSAPRRMNPQAHSLALIACRLSLRQILDTPLRFAFRTFMYVDDCPPRED